MQRLQFSAEKTESSITLKTLLILSSRTLLDLFATLGIRTRLRVSLSPVHSVKGVSVFAGVAFVSHRIKNVDTVKAPFYSTLAVNVLATRRELHKCLAGRAFLQSILLCVLSHLLVLN